MPIIKDNRDLDTTITTFAGSLLAGAVTGGLFWLHAQNPAASLLSPEIVMALLQLPATFIAYSLGKKAGTSEMNGNGTKETKQ